jgi:general secretion pathway protein L
MTSLRQIADLFARWMDAVAALVVAILRRFTAPNAVELIEEDDGTFVVQKPGATPSGRPFERVRIADGRIAGAHADGVEQMLRGSRADVVLRSDRFLLRPLELPQRAGEFLDGVVRAQIDRLTPWSAADAVFGWSEPREAGPDRIAVTVAATARALVLPYVQALTALGAQAVTVSTLLPGSDAAPTPIKVLEHMISGALDAARVRRAVIALLLIAAVAAGVSFGASAVVTGNLSARQDELARRIAERRAAIRSGRERADLASTPQRMLERRKYESPSTVLVLDALSQILPDHTYVIELRIEADQLRVIGITRDAPSLIRLIEQNPLFSRATFFAPTTRSPSDPGERFHIEAHIEPMVVPRS